MLEYSSEGRDVEADDERDEEDEDIYEISDEEGYEEWDETCDDDEICFEDSSTASLESVFEYYPETDSSSFHESDDKSTDENLEARYEKFDRWTTRWMVQLCYQGPIPHGIDETKEFEIENAFVRYFSDILVIAKEKPIPCQNTLFRFFKPLDEVITEHIREYTYLNGKVLELEERIREENENPRGPLDCYTITIARVLGIMEKLKKRRKQYRKKSEDVIVCMAIAFRNLSKATVERTKQPNKSETWIENFLAEFVPEFPKPYNELRCKQKFWRDFFPNDPYRNI